MSLFTLASDQQTTAPGVPWRRSALRNGIGISLALLVTFFVTFQVSADQLKTESSDTHDAAAEPIEKQILGEWVQYRETPNGRFMRIKQHLGDQTLVTTYDPNQNVVASHRSEYTVDTRRDVFVFRFWNRVILAGPGAGAKDPQEHSYVFRVVGDKFYEVNGVLRDDARPPSLSVWERLKENPIPKPQASRRQQNAPIAFFDSPEDP